MHAAPVVFIVKAFGTQVGVGKSKRQNSGIEAGEDNEDMVESTTFKVKHNELPSLILLTSYQC